MNVDPRYKNYKEYVKTLAVLVYLEKKPEDAKKLLWNKLENNPDDSSTKRILDLMERPRYQE